MDDMTVYLVDDDVAVRQSLELLLASSGYRVQTFESAEQFLTSLSRGQFGCVVSDIRLGGMNGIELQYRMNQSGLRMPLIVISGHANVPIAVEMMRNGAITVLEKPFPPDQLLSAVQAALEIAVADRQRHDQINDVRTRLATLTAEEEAVMKLMIQGVVNKTIASDLEISLRTMERRKSIIMEKMGVTSLPELSRLITLLEINQKPERQS